MLVLVLSVLSGDCLNAENRRENDLDSPETKEVEVEEEEEAEVEVGGGVEMVEGVGSVEVVLSGVFLVPVAVRVFVLVLLVANILVVLVVLVLVLVLVVLVLVVLVLWSMVSSTRATITPHLADRALPNSMIKAE